MAFTAPPGVTALVGPSGAGKSTTLALVSGLLRPDAGLIRLGDTVLFRGEVGGASDDASATRRREPESKVDLTPDRRQVGVVFQSLALFPHLDARDNVAYGIKVRSRIERRERAQVWLERCEAGHVADQRVESLSGGEAQRVALARALASEPRLLLLDEPFSALDAELRDGLRRTVARVVRDVGIPCVLVTHDRTDALAMAEQAVLLRAGMVVAAGPAAEVLRS